MDRCVRRHHKRLLNSEQTKQNRNKVINTESKLMVGGGEGSKGRVGEGKGIQKYKLPVIKLVTHSTGNRVNNIVITTYSDRWLLDLLYALGIQILNHHVVHLKLI